MGRERREGVVAGGGGDGMWGRDGQTDRQTDRETDTIFFCFVLMSLVFVFTVLATEAYIFRRNRVLSVGTAEGPAICYTSFPFS